MHKRILSLLVDNTAGVLSRISGLFSRRGYNIDSLTVGVTADERYSRMTVVCSGDSMILEQITKQLAKLVDVRDIKVLEPDNSEQRTGSCQSCSQTGAAGGNHFYCKYFSCQCH